MGYPVVEHVYSNAAATATLNKVTCTLSFTPAAGNALLLVASADAAKVSSITQTGVTWSVSHPYDVGQSPYLAICQGRVGAAAASTSVVVTMAAAVPNKVSIIVLEVSGVYDFPRLATGGSSSIGGSVTASSASTSMYALRLGAVMVDGHSKTLGAASGWTQRAAPAAAATSGGTSLALYTAQPNVTGAQIITPTTSVTTEKWTLGTLTWVNAAEPEVDIAQTIVLYMTTGTWALGTNVFYGPIRPPATNAPTEAVFCYALPGSTNYGYLQNSATSPEYRSASVRVVVRSSPQSYRSGVLLAREIRLAIHGVLPDATYISSRAREAEPEYYGEDDDGSHLFGFTMDVEYTA
jgi:hypothetical protein